jgi:Double zinc ribbon
MQHETTPGKALTAAPDATARGLSRCLACQHENKIGERLCEACGSSLNLKLCAACEAVNGDAAVTCYSCGAALGGAAGSEVKAEGTLAVAKARRLRARWALSLAALLALTVLTYQYFSQPGETAVAQSKESEGASARVAAPLSSASAPLSSGSAPLRDVALDAATPAAAGQSAGVASTPKASRAHVRVTHTRPAEPGASAASPPPALPAPAARERAPAAQCSEAVAALALCEIRDNRGGK